MIGLGSPLWLFALVAIPLIRWLHRWQAPLSTATVSAAFLWDPAVSLGSGRERKQEPEPEWRRRALIAGLLALALAQPWWQRDSGIITVWIDDSLSMSADERGVSRLAVGLGELRQALSDAGPGRVVLRSLSNPARAMSDSDPAAFDVDQWLTSSQGEPDPPPPALLSQQPVQWLVTDGADTRLLAWATKVAPDRIIRIGEATENVAVTRLAARRSLTTSEAVNLLIEVSNRGKREATRELHLASAGADFDVRVLTLAAGETRYLTASQTFGGEAITAALSPGDAVRRDDAITLQPSVLRAIPVNLDNSCPAGLSLAIRAHPALALAAAGAAAELQVDCSARARNAAAVLRFHTSAATPLSAPAEWHPGVGRLQELYLQPYWIAAAAWDVEPADKKSTLLAADGTPLVIRRSIRPPVIETVLDMSRPAFVRQPEYAALIAGLVDLALGRAALDAVAIAKTEPQASDIVPADVRGSDARQRTQGVIRQSLTNLFLTLAVLLIAADMVLLYRAARELQGA